MFTLLAVGLHVGLRSIGAVEEHLVYIPILIGLLWDGLFVATCLKVLIEW